METEHKGDLEDLSQGIQTPEERAAELGIQEHTSTTIDFEKIKNSDANDPFSDMHIEDSADYIREATRDSEEELFARSGWYEGEVTPDTFYSDEELLKAGVDPKEYHRTVEDIIRLKRSLDEARKNVNKVGPGIIEKIGTAIIPEDNVPTAKEIVAKQDLKRAEDSLHSAHVRMMRLNKQVTRFQQENEKAA